MKSNLSEKNDLISELEKRINSLNSDLNNSKNENESNEQKIEEFKSL